MQRDREGMFRSFCSESKRAINNPIRQNILMLLWRSETGKLAFTEIQQSIGVKSSSKLAHHLNVLQRAWLVERTTDLTSPLAAEDPYYCFYTLTKLGKNVTRNLASLEKELHDDLDACFPAQASTNEAVIK